MRYHAPAVTFQVPPLRILIDSEEPYGGTGYCAHSLETGITGQGETQRAALKDLILAIEMMAEDVYEADGVEGLERLFNAGCADQFRLSYNRARRKSSITISLRVPTSGPPLRVSARKVIAKAA